MNFKTKKIGLLTLGLTLIIVGTILLINQYSDTNLFQDFFILWPVFLIALGLEFILTKLYYDFKKEQVHLSPSGLSIFLAIIVIFTSFFWHQAGNYNFPFNIRINNNNWINYTDQIIETYNPDPYDISSTDKLVVKNLRGSVNIIPADSETLEVEARITISTNDRDEAKKLISDVVNVSTGKTTTVTTINPGNQNIHQIDSIDLIISIPSHIHLDIDTSFGDVDIDGMESDVSINQRHGGIRAKNINGNLSIDGRFSNMEIYNIINSIKITNEHSMVQVEQIFGDANIINRHGDTVVKKVSGDVDVENRHGNIAINEAGGNVRASNEHSISTFNMISGNLIFKGRHSNVDISNVVGDMDIETEHGYINLRNPSYDNVEIIAKTEHNNIQFDKSIDISINSEGNQEGAHGITGDGEQRISLINRHGRINVEK